MAIVLWPMESTVLLESMSHKTAVSSSAITSLHVAVLRVAHMRSVCQLVFRDPFGILLSCAVYIAYVWSLAFVPTQCLPLLLREVPFFLIPKPHVVTFTAVSMSVV